MTSAEQDIPSEVILQWPENLLLGRHISLAGNCLNYFWYLMALYQLTNCQHCLNIIRDITEHRSVTLLLVLLRLQRLDLHTLNNRLMNLWFCVIKNSTKHEASKQNAISYYKISFKRNMNTWVLQQKYVMLPLKPWQYWCWRDEEGRWNENNDKKETGRKYKI